ncbi:hypothetical protein FPQ18DRAFT_308740 [Pyronema domesticum]|nr:hypothetical protein FPQ18DRAFT_308740 [Pyronema domesticum]
MEQYIMEQPQTVPAPSSRIKAVEQKPAQSVPEKLDETRAPSKVNDNSNDPRITTSVLCTAPTQVLNTQPIDPTSTQYHHIQQPIHQPNVHPPPSRHDILQTILEQEEISALDDINFTLMSGLETVQRELARVIEEARRKEASRKLGAFRTPSFRIERGPPPAIPPRPVGLTSAMGGLSIHVPEEQSGFDIMSMEQLDDGGSSASSVQSFGHFIEMAAISGGLDFSKPPTAPAMMKEIPHFPIIEDILSDFEACVSSPEPTERGDYVDDGLTSCDESRNGFSDESLCNSPTTSVSSTDEDDIDVETLDGDKKIQRPTFLQMDSGYGTDFDTEREILEMPDTISEEPTTSELLVKQPLQLVRATRSPAPKRAPKKNNGHKRVPKKARLSSSARQRFLSRAFW